MFTARVSRIVVFLTIALFTLTACSGNAAADLVKVYAQANSNGDALASRASVQFNSRNTCDFSSGVQLLARIDSHSKALDVTTDAWLDQQMNDFSCILPKEAE